MEQYRAVFADPDPPRSYEARVQRPDGSERVVEARADFLVRDGERVAMISAIRDVTERKRLDQAQQDFVAMASHDLASPLTVLRARAQLLLRRQAYDEESMTAILEQTARMDRLIGDLRELAQVEGGGLSLQRETVDLVALAEEAVERARTLPHGHAVRLEAPEASGRRGRGPRPAGAGARQPPRQRHQVLARRRRDRGPRRVGCGGKRA